ncbi:FHA domain-containing protein [bacterium]|nr:FHA domain-containing protein [bacterium]
MRVELRFTRGPRAGQSLALDDNQTVIIGRGVETTFRIDDPSISRRHCQITNSPQGVLIADLGSSNGTYVNAQRIGTWVQLGPHDEVILGNNQVQIYVPSASQLPHLRCSSCHKEISPADEAAGRVRQDTNGQVVCADCLKKFDFDPHLIEGYLIEKKLGSGAFGSVFKATQVATGRVVALKTTRTSRRSTTRARTAGLTSSPWSTSTARS